MFKYEYCIHNIKGKILNGEETDHPYAKMLLLLNKDTQRTRALWAKHHESLVANTNIWNLSHYLPESEYQRKNLLWGFYASL